MPVISPHSDGVPTIAYCLTDLAGRLLAERNSDLQFYSASTIKLAVLIAALRMVDEGALNLDQTVYAQHEFISGAPSKAIFDFASNGIDIDLGMPSPGTQMSLRDVLRRMITVSSNEATNMTILLTGLEAVTAALQLCGAAQSKMERLVGDLEAMEMGLTNETTPRDLTLMLSAIITGRAASPSSTRLMMGFLQNQEIGIIGPAVPAKTWGSKSGWTLGIRHDVAYLIPDDTHVDDGLILAVCTRAYDSQSADEAIQAIATLAWSSRQTRKSSD